MALQLLLAVVFAATATCPALAERRLFIRDIPGKGQQCRNTFSGLRMVADDRGVVCKRTELSYVTGCCAGGQQHDCSGCDLKDNCCSEFEACVSCCLAPKHDAAKLAKEVLRSPRHSDSGVWGDAFEYCQGVCRTHSRSTSHENSYIGARHHCFSKLGRPMLSDPLPANALQGVELVVGGRNATCSQACAGHGQQQQEGAGAAGAGEQQQQGLRCSQEHLRWLNSCDRLREHYGCEAGCEEATGVGPGYVHGGAPKAARPAMCFAQPPARAVLSCEQADPHMHMLCPCVR